MFVCSSHHEEVVSSKGKGCKVCAKELAAWRARREAKKAARRERDEYIREHGQNNSKKKSGNKA